MDHGREVARSTTVEFNNLVMAGAVQLGGEAHMSTRTFHGQLGAAAARCASFEATAAAYHNSDEFAHHVRAAAGRREVPTAVFLREPAPGRAYANIVGAVWRQPGPVGVVLVCLQLPGEVMPVHDNYYGYSALQHRPGAGRGVVLADQLPGGGDYALQPRPGAGHGEVLVDLLPYGAGVLYSNYPLPTCPGAAGHAEVFVGVLTEGIFAQQMLSGTARADAIVGVLREPNLGAGREYRGVVPEHLRRLLAFVGIGASSVAVNGLATGPGSPSVAFHLFVLLLGGLFLVILHVLRV